MKKQVIFWFLSLFIVGVIFTGCNDDDDDNGPTPDPNTVTDVDGNVYPTIVIGSQEWMAENLKTTRYSDGSNIDFPGNDTIAWRDASSGAYAWYNNDEGNKSRYGGIYNWYAVNDTRGLCPAGWRVPTYDDWNQMMNFLLNEHELTNDLEDIVALGNRLKSCRQVDSPLGGECATNQHPRWNSHPTHHGTNDFGFAGLPGGGRSNRGAYANIGVYGFWWTSTEAEEGSARYKNLNFDQSPLFNGNTPKNVGISVRCVKN